MTRDCAWETRWRQERRSEGLAKLVEDDFHLLYSYSHSLGARPCDLVYYIQTVYCMQSIQACWLFQEVIMLNASKCQRSMLICFTSLIKDRSRWVSLSFSWAGGSFTAYVVVFVLLNQCRCSSVVSSFWPSAPCTADVAGTVVRCKVTRSLPVS